VALYALAPALPAQAAGLPLLVVHRTDDAVDCPDARALAALVAEQMKRPALEPAGEVPPGPGRGLDVQIYRSAQGLTAVILARGKTRQISDKGATCGGLTVALAVSIAVLLDTEPLPPEPEPPPLLPVVMPPPAPTSAPPPPDAPPLPAQPVEDGFSDVTRVRVTLSTAPVITVGLLHSPAFGITSEVEVRFGRFSVAGGFLALPSQTFTLAPMFAPGQVSLDLTAGLLRGCAMVAGDGAAMRLSFCLEPSGGIMRGVGHGFSTDLTSTLPWVALGTSAIFQQRIWGPLSWGGRAGLLIPLLKTSFMVDNVGTAFAPPPVGGAWDTELRVSIW
jgi:hypothetical protein